ncbi:MAG: DUF2786 domain-containing protein [Microthrixaceae bacterium]
MSSSTIRVIQKLLSRAEATDFESERDACLSKVAELMARHSIEEALLRSDQPEQTVESPTERLLVVPAPYAARKVSLFGAVGEHAGCTVIDLGTDDSGVRRVAAVGFPADLDRMEVLVTSLLVQLTRSMLESPTRPKRSAGATAAWRRSFVSGFTWRVSERLHEANKAQASDAERGAVRRTDRGTSVALALIERQDAVDDEVSRRYPYLRTRRMDGGSSHDGHRAGRAAGNRAGLGDAALRGKPELSA